MDTDTDNVLRNRPEPEHPTEDDSAEQMTATDREALRSKTTMDVYGSQLPPDILPGDAYTTLQPDMIAFHLPGLEAPIVIQGKTSIILGRGEGSNLVLSDIQFDADSQDLMSVSRRHAIVRRTEAGFSIEDLNSTNGTWINGRILIPGQPYRLRSADQVRLGEQILYVYLSISAKRAVHTLLLEDPAYSWDEESDDEPAPADLLEKAERYLQMVVKIQQILDTAQDYPSAVAIQNLAMHKNGRWVEVRIRGANQAIEVIGHNIAQLNAIGDNNHPEASALDPDPRIMAATHMATAREILATVAPDLMGERFHQLAEELVPHIAAIVRTGFKIVSWTGQ